MFEGGAELALVVVRIDARIDRGEIVDYADRRPGGAGAAVAVCRQGPIDLVAVRAARRIAKIGADLGVPIDRQRLLYAGRAGAIPFVDAADIDFLLRRQAG